MRLRCGYGSACLFALLVLDSADCRSNEAPRETRAYRDILRSRDKNLPKIQSTALRDELLVIPGAAMSALEVVHALKTFIDEIEKHGLTVGKYGQDYIKETIDGRILGGF